MLPDGNYEKVIIHDNFKALERFANANMFGKIAHYGLRHFNGRFIVFYFNSITLISTGMGSAQTNCLVELLKERGCRVIVKVGTCSALDSRLCECDILIPDGALIDEGASYWQKVKQDHDRRYFYSQSSVDKYITDRDFVSPIKNCKQSLWKSVKWKFHHIDQISKVNVCGV